MTSEATFFEPEYPIVSPSTCKLMGRIAAAGAIIAALSAGSACESMPTGPVIPRGQQAPVEYIHEQPVHPELPQNRQPLTF